MVLLLTLMSREMTELEATVSTMESSLKTVSENFVSLRRNLLELKQIKEMLSRADGFLTEHRHHLEEEEVEAAASKAEREETSGMEIHVTAGVIDRSRWLFNEESSSSFSFPSSS